MLEEFAELITVANMGGRTVNCEEYWKRIAELKKRLDDAKRQMKPEDPEADLWVPVHDTDTGQVAWFPKAMYDELQKYHMLARGLISKIPPTGK